MIRGRDLFSQHLPLIGAFVFFAVAAAFARRFAALEAGKLPTMLRSTGATLDVSALLATRELDVMIRDRYLVLDDAWAKRFARYADLQHQWDQETIALFVGPISSTKRTRA